MSNKTKPQLVKDLKELKTKYREVLDENDQLKKELETKVEEGKMPFIGVSPFYQNNKWSLAYLSFDPETGTAKISEVVEVSSEFSMARHKMDAFFADKIYLPFLRKEKK